MKKIQLFIAFILNLIPVIVIAACPFKPEQVGANYLEHKGPENEDYEVYFVGTTLQGGDDKRFFANPVYVILSKQDCEIKKAIKLLQGTHEQNMILNKDGGNILIISDTYEKTNGRTTISNSISLFDYETLAPLGNKKLTNNILFPKTSMLVAEEGKYLYSTLAGGKEIYKLNIADLVFEGKFSIDDEYMSSMKLGEIKYILLTNSKENSKSNKKHWSNVIGQPLIDLWGTNEKGEYRGFAFNLAGDVLKAGWTIGKKSFSDTPEVYAKKFNIKIKPLPFIALTPDAQGKALSPLETVEPREQNSESKQNTQQVEQNETVKQENMTTPRAITETKKQRSARQDPSFNIQQLLFIVAGIFLLGAVVFYLVRKKK